MNGSLNDIDREKEEAMTEWGVACGRKGERPACIQHGKMNKSAVATGEMLRNDTCVWREGVKYFASQRVH